MSDSNTKIRNAIFEWDYRVHGPTSESMSVLVRAAEELLELRAASKPPSVAPPRICTNCGTNERCDCYAMLEDRWRETENLATHWETKCDDARAKVATLEAELSRLRCLEQAAMSWRDLRYQGVLPGDAPDDDWYLLSAIDTFTRSKP